MDNILILMILMDFLLLGSSRLGFCNRIVAFQGIVLGILPLLAHSREHGILIVAIAVCTAMIKGFIFPALIRNALKKAEVQREVEPYIGYNVSVLFGLSALMMSIYVSSRIPLPGHVTMSVLGIPAAMMTILTGLFIIITRKKALTQTLGYLVMENGIYEFGVLFALRDPLIIELGILLDVFVAVFLMGIISFHISRSFDHIDSDRLASIHDLMPISSLSDLKGE